jgi:hypothetical protein
LAADAWKRPPFGFSRSKAEALPLGAATVGDLIRGLV